MLLLATLPMFALSYHAVNVDKVTAAAMTAAYASEAEMEAMNTSNLQKIVDHYKSHRSHCGNFTIQEEGQGCHA